MKVLHGVTNQAGQPWALAEGLRHIGVQADSCGIRPHKFGYPSHISLELGEAGSLEDTYEALLPLIGKYDVFHFHARSFLMRWPELDAPSLQDLMLLKLHGKKIFFHFRGQEIRLASEFKRLNPYHYCDEAAGHLFEKMPDASKLLFREAVSSICDGVFVVDEELQSYVPGSTVVPRSLDANRWKNLGVSDRDVPIVVHAPSRRGVKGTPEITQAVNELHEEGLKFDFRIVEDLSHEKAVSIYREADIMIDQIRIGWYGVFAVEGMAMGKPVIAYVRGDLWDNEALRPPVVNANPSNIKDKLRQVIQSRELRRSLAAQARTYFEDVHCSVAVATKLVKIYEEAESPVVLSGYSRLLSHQHAIAEMRLDTALEQLERWKVKSEPSLVRLTSRIDYLRQVARSDGPGAATSLVGSWFAKRFRQDGKRTND